MNKEIRPIAEERVDPEVEKRNLKRTYNRIGLALIALVILSKVLASVVKAIAESDDTAAMFLSKYALLTNSFVVGTVILGASFVLKFIPKSQPICKKLSAKEFITYAFVALGVSCIGNLITQFFTGFIYFVSGIELTDRVSAAIGSAAPLQVFLSVVVLAPITEEFFFRKMLIDRMYKHGELLAILTSAVFFGLYHQNIFQMIPTFASGVMLGYIYCKTGSYLYVTVLHAIFNFVGVFSVIFNPKLIKYSQMSYEELTALPAEIYAEYRAVMLFYMICIIITAAINIIGIVLFVLKRKNFSTENNAPVLLESDKREIIVRTPGIFIAGVAMILMTVHSLFV